MVVAMVMHMLRTMTMARCIGTWRSEEGIGSLDTDDDDVDNHDDIDVDGDINVKWDVNVDVDVKVYADDKVHNDVYAIVDVDVCDDQVYDKEVLHENEVIN